MLKSIPYRAIIRNCPPKSIQVRGIRAVVDPRNYRSGNSLFRSPFDDPFFQIPSILHSTLPSFFKEEGTQWMRPALDVSDTPTHYKIKVELPGMNKEAVKISLKDDILTIEGERKEEKVDKDETRYIKESSFGSFCRQISVPADADVEQIQANMNNGILEIQVGKKPEAQVPEAKTIPIQSSE